MFRIAICDDEPAVCSQIETILLNYSEESNLDIEIQVFYSGEELCKFLEDGEGFDLIFLDIELKLINGIEVAYSGGKSKKEERHAPHHILSWRRCA